MLLLLAIEVQATNYYISNSLGSDSNSGTNSSAPWKSLSKVTNTTFVPGDRIYLKRGDTWVNQRIVLNGSGTPGNLIRLEAYGNGDRPHIKGDGGNVIYGLNISNWVIKNLKIELPNPDHIDTNTNDHDAPVGIYIRTKHTAPQKNIYIEDNEIFSSGHMTNTGGIRFRADAPSKTYSTTIVENMWFTGNEIHDLGFFGFRSVSNTSGVAGPFKKVQWHNNILYDIGLQGMVMENVDGGEMRFNLVHHAGQYTGTIQKWGPAGIWPIQSSNILIENNEVHDMASFHNSDGTGIDVDWGTKYVTVNDNYVHHNHGPGIVVLTSDYTTVTNNQ